MATLILLVCSRVLFVDYAGYEITVRRYVRIPAEEVSRRFQGREAARRTEQFGKKKREARGPKREHRWCVDGVALNI